jgi:hypothetical protein
MSDRIGEVALTIFCRKKRCGARPGEPCKSRERSLHRVRYNDAYRLLVAQLKMEDWKQRYGSGEKMP